MSRTYSYVRTVDFQSFPFHALYWAGPTMVWYRQVPKADDVL